MVWNNWRAVFMNTSFEIEYPYSFFDLDTIVTLHALFQSFAVILHPHTAPSVTIASQPVSSSNILWPQSSLRSFLHPANGTVCRKDMVPLSPSSNVTTGVKIYDIKKSSYIFCKEGITQWENDILGRIWDLQLSIFYDFIFAIILFWTKKRKV